MANAFRIIRPVWLHNRVFKAGQEEALEEAGFTAAQQKEQVGRGAVVEVKGKPAAKKSEPVNEDGAKK